MTAPRQPTSAEFVRPMGVLGTTGLSGPALPDQPHMAQVVHWTEWLVAAVGMVVGIVLGMATA